MNSSNDSKTNELNLMKPNYVHDKRRFETFFDAVIAIILTILVLELKVPEMEVDCSTRIQLVKLLPSFLSYLGSFMLIVGLWIDHSMLFSNVVRINKRYIVLNMFFILSLSVVPFTTAFAGHNHHDVFAVALLFGNYFIMNILFAILYWYGNLKGFIIPAFLTENRANEIYSQIGIVALLVAIPLAYFSTYLSFALGILIFSGHLIKKK